MTFGTKKGHFNAHKIAPVSNLVPFFIAHDYTSTRQRAINSALNIPWIAVTQFAHGFAGGEGVQPGYGYREALFIYRLLLIIKNLSIHVHVWIIGTFHIIPRSQM